MQISLFSNQENGDTASLLIFVYINNEFEKETWDLDLFTLPNSKLLLSKT